ncbi:MAG: hypothetical protein ACK5OX_01460 [Desertimonas sp.]
MSDAPTPTTSTGGGWLRLRPVALVARDLDPVLDDLRAVFGLEVGFRDPHIGSLGLHNIVGPVGGQFLEVVSPIVEGTTAERYLNRRGGDGGYMVITQTERHAPRRAHVDRLGIRIVGQFDADGFTNMQLHPADTGGSFLEIDQQAGGESLDGPWSPAGPDWQDARRTGIVDAITAVELQCDDPARTAARWSEIIELPVAAAASGPTIGLDNATVRFMPVADGRGEGLGAIDVHVVDAARARTAATERGLVADDGSHVLIGGMRFHLR